MQREERVELEPGQCPSCGVELSAHEVERGAAVCARCDEQLDRELAAYLAFIAECRR